MIVVLDTSAAIRTVFSGKDAIKVEKVLSSASLVMSPELFVAEATNALWKYQQFADIPSSVCEKALGRALELVDEYCPCGSLAKESYGLACQLSMPAYDMFFLVLARRNNAKLLTLDGEMRDMAKTLGIKLALG